MISFKIKIYRPFPNKGAICEFMAPGLRELMEALKFIRRSIFMAFWNSI